MKFSDKPIGPADEQRNVKGNAENRTIFRKIKQGAYLLGSAALLGCAAIGCAKLTSPQAPPEASSKVQVFHSVFGDQFVEDSLRGGEIFYETSTFVPPMQLDTSGGNVTGLPAWSQVSVLGGNYFLVAVGTNSAAFTDSIILAKEAADSTLSVGGSISINGLRFQLQGVNPVGYGAAASMSILDSAGNVMKQDVIPVDQTMTYSVNGKNYVLQVSLVSPSPASAAVRIFSDPYTVRSNSSNGPDTIGGIVYDFSINWTACGQQLQSWQFTKTQ